MTYTKDNLRQIFQQPFNQERWQTMLQHYFHATELRAERERIEDTDDEEQGYYLGAIDTTDNYRIGLFYYQIQYGNVARKRVGLRNLVKSFINPNWGEFDAALVVFDSGLVWRLSFVCDIKDEKTAAKRFTYVFGESDNYYNTPVGRFDALQRNGISFENIKDAFSVEALTKEFYNDLFNWFQWAVNSESGIYFPNNTDTDEDDFEDIEKKIIRLITRLMFVWFIKQKELIPSTLFDENELSDILLDFDPNSTTQGNYYNAILQNLFFATLNRAIEDEEGKRGFAKLQGQRDVKTLYRYAEMFRISEDEVLQLFAKIPFLNGGLFECLDKTKKIDGVEKAYNYDGFSRNDSRFPNGRYRQRAFIPNIFFFDAERGLLNILKRYNFTIEENTPTEQQVALDPELLGKVFENLLGAYNPETKETARNQSGSFYTPREIVGYMVDESLIAYLGDTPLVRSMFKDDFTTDKLHWSDYQMIAGKLKSIKVLDPACGSGAFPMGLLNRIVDLLQKIETDKTTYELKLNIIENCIYGCDIQSIAAQITKLRFFISLICDCEKDVSKPNFGIPTLPNLETKFVTANSLIGLKKVKVGEFVGTLFENPEIGPTKIELARIRHEHFLAKTASAKSRLRKRDQELREKLTILLSDDNDFAPEDAKQMATWNPYDQNTVSPFFDAEWMFGVAEGFDIVIGNPPYIQLQNNGGELAKLYENCGYSTFARTGDIYCLFYERGWQLLKEKGHLCYITSNKWMRAGYGEKTREFFANKTNPMLLIDFAGVKIFESATVDTNILLFAKSNNKHKTVCAVTNKQNKDSVKNLSDFVQQQNSICNFTTSDSWVILSPIEQSIKKKIEAVGTPLKDWDINIYRGVLTGYNEAFIIDSEKRNEILANCQTEDERKRTAELIRPILRGRDIKRYGYVDNGLYLINTHNGVRGRIPRIKIEDYPAVKAHLDLFWDKIEKRADQGDTPYNLRNCAYLEDFFKPKITWGNLNLEGAYSYVPEGIFINAPSPFIATTNIAILHILNSRIADYYIRSLGVTRNGGYFEYKPMFVEKFPVPQNDLTMLNTYPVQPTKVQEKEIEKYIYHLYKLSSQEVAFLENREV
jgi:hypothetical protein